MAENNMNRESMMNPQEGTGREGRKSNRGFAAMNKDEQREIARKGGEAVSRNREHMAEIGRRGGEASGSNRSKANQVQGQPQASNLGQTQSSGLDSDTLGENL